MKFPTRDGSPGQPKLPSMPLFSRATSLKSSDIFLDPLENPWFFKMFLSWLVPALASSTLKGRQFSSVLNFSILIPAARTCQNHPGSLVGSPTSWYCWSPQSLVPCPQWSPTQWPAVFFFFFQKWSDDPMTGAKHQGRLAVMVGSLFRDIAHQLCHLSKKVFFFCGRCLLNVTIVGDRKAKLRWQKFKHGTKTGSNCDPQSIRMH